VTQEKKKRKKEKKEKHLLFLCFDLFCRFFWIFFLFSFSLFPRSAVIVDFIGTMKPNKAFEVFFFFSVTFFYY